MVLMQAGIWRRGSCADRSLPVQKLLRLLVGLLALSFVAGSSSAALACVAMPAASVSAAMPADCPDQPAKAGKHGRALACVPMCAALGATVEARDHPPALTGECEFVAISPAV